MLELYDIIKLIIGVLIIIKIINKLMNRRYVDFNNNMSNYVTILDSNRNLYLYMYDREPKKIANNVDFVDTYKKNISIIKNGSLYVLSNHHNEFVHIDDDVKSVFSVNTFMRYKKNNDKMFYIEYYRKPKFKIMKYIKWDLSDITNISPKKFTFNEKVHWPETCNNYLAYYNIMGMNNEYILEIIDGVLHKYENSEGIKNKIKIMENVISVNGSF